MDGHETAGKRVLGGYSVGHAFAPVDLVGQIDVTWLWFLLRLLRHASTQPEILLNSCVSRPFALASRRSLRGFCWQRAHEANTRYLCATTPNHALVKLVSHTLLKGGSQKPVEPHAAARATRLCCRRNSNCMKSSLKNQGCSERRETLRNGQ